MDLTLLLHSLILGTVEGLTEFLPISSTGHLILVGEMIGFESSEGRVFEVIVQLGAILAVCWLYRQKIARLVRGVFSGDVIERRFATAIVIAFLPAAIIGALTIDFIKQVLFSPQVVATSLVVGGFILLWIESRPNRPVIETSAGIGWRQALAIGVAQCFAMIPGTSRSGATIVGGLLAGLSRPVAAEFSFFLAMPTMLGAAVYDGWRHHHLLTASDTMAIGVGFVAAFLSALLVVRALVHFIATHTFRVFAWYRIALGTVLMVVFGFGGLG